MSAYRQPKPKTRSAARLRLGGAYFTLRRHIQRLLGGYRFARIRGETPEFEAFSHATPLLRQLKNLDMRLQYNKVTNLKIAVSRLDGVTLFPGETFSYWRCIGRPTRQKGYLDGMILRNGKLASAVGGGLCQLSNLIYWMALHTPLTVTERHRHGYDVFPDDNRTQPFGSGATCFYNYGDLTLYNGTDAVFQLRLEVTETELRGRWLSDAPPEYTYEVYEKEHIIRTEAWGGYSRSNVLFRRKYDAATREQTADELVAENRAVMMYAPLLGEAKP
jgi:vancomycin resistance protein VanW